MSYEIVDFVSAKVNFFKSESVHKIGNGSTAVPKNRTNSAAQSTLT